MPLGRQVLTNDAALAAGQRDKYVTIQRMTESSPDGFPVETWTTLTRVWMNKIDLRADERFRASQESAASETQWHLSYREDMDPENLDVPKTRRLVYRGRTYDILTASRIGSRGIELVTLAGSKVA